MFLARDAHPHADAGLGRLGELLGDEVVEEAVELRQRRLDAHACHGTLAGGLDPCRGTRRLREAHKQRRLRRLRPGLPTRDRHVLAHQAPKKSLSACTRSSRSHVKSGSSRPKWPWAAVFA